MNSRARHKAQEELYARPWTGELRQYDLVKEFVAALGIMTLLTVVLAVIFGSPDRKAITLQEWAANAPNDFVATTVAELDHTSGTATYGAPYVDDPTAGQKLGPLALQRWAGVREPIDTAQDFVIDPLSTNADPAAAAAMAQYQAATAQQQDAWAKAYGEALTAAPDGDPKQVAIGDYGPVPAMADALRAMAQRGALDRLISEPGSDFYQANYSRSLLFLADGSYLADQASAENLSGDQWGMMNETGRYPGQAWLWLYTFWYQIQPFSSSDNADALVWGLMMLLSLALVLLPFIPGLRAVPRRLGVYRLIWRAHYRNNRR